VGGATGLIGGGGVTGRFEFNGCCHICDAMLCDTCIV
jgi:hypothetical protein